MDGGDSLAFVCCLSSSIWSLSKEGAVSSCAEGKREWEERRNTLLLEEKENLSAVFMRRYLVVVVSLVWVVSPEQK